MSDAINSVPGLEERRITVLLIDDQPFVGEAVRRMLAPSADIDFHFCADPKEALQRAAAVAPTVILQDLVMPDVDGLTLLRSFRADPATRDVPMIVLSTKEEPKVKAEAFALGAHDYLVKLPDPIELVARIRHHSAGYIAHLQRNAAYEALKRSRRTAGRRTGAGGQRGVDAAGEAERRYRHRLAVHPSKYGSAAIRSAITGSTPTISPSTCSTSASTASARRCCRSRR